MGYKDWDGSKVLSRVHWAKESPRSVQIGEQNIKQKEKDMNDIFYVRPIHKQNFFYNLKLICTSFSNSELFVVCFLS